MGRLEYPESIYLIGAIPQNGSMRYQLNYFGKTLVERDDFVQISVDFHEFL